jgi:hypothetical protein
MVEKVVKPPQNPVPRSGRRYEDSGSRSCRRVVKYPSRNAPARLTANVAHGHSPASCGRASLSSARATAPANPPQKIAASSRRSARMPSE